MKRNFLLAFSDFFLFFRNTNWQHQVVGYSTVPWGNDYFGIAKWKRGSNYVQKKIIVLAKVSLKFANDKYVLNFKIIFVHKHKGFFRQNHFIVYIQLLPYRSGFYMYNSTLSLFLSCYLQIIKACVSRSSFFSFKYNF